MGWVPVNKSNWQWRVAGSTVPAGTYYAINDRAGRGIGESEDDDYYYSAAPGYSAPKFKSRIDSASMGASSVD